MRDGRDVRGAVAHVAAGGGARDAGLAVVVGEAGAGGGGAEEGEAELHAEDGAVHADARDVAHDAGAEGDFVPVAEVGVVRGERVGGGVVEGPGAPAEALRGGEFEVGERHHELEGDVVGLVEVSDFLGLLGRGDGGEVDGAEVLGGVQVLLDRAGWVDRVVLFRGVFAAVLEDDGNAAGVLVEEVGHVVDSAFDDDPAGLTGVVLGNLDAVEHLGCWRHGGWSRENCVRHGTRKGLVLRILFA